MSKSNVARVSAEPTPPVSEKVAARPPADEALAILADDDAFEKVAREVLEEHRELLARLADHPELASAPDDDEVEMPEEATVVAVARAEIARGEGISHDDLLRELGM